VAAARLHVDMSGQAPRIMLEPDIPEPDSALPKQRFDSLSMYFGGVAAARYDVELGFETAADQRREGGVFVSNA
jgi:hypothetical protein